MENRSFVWILKRERPLFSVWKLRYLDLFKTLFLIVIYLNLNHHRHETSYRPKMMSIASLRRQFPFINKLFCEEGLCPFFKGGLPPNFFQSPLNSDENCFEWKISLESFSFRKFKRIKGWSRIQKLRFKTFKS